jgi:hypothetical protein
LLPLEASLIKGNNTIVFAASPLAERVWTNKERLWCALVVDEGRKRVLLIAASILAARKLAHWDGRPSPALESAIADAITIAERIMARIDSR